MIRTEEDKYEGITVYDEDTGEVFYHQPARKKKLADFDKYVGVDTKYPNECITKESLLESLSVLDAYLDKGVSIASDMLLDSVVQNLITPQQLKVIKHVASNLTAWNIYIGTTKDLYTSGVDEKSMKRVLDDLYPNILRVTSRNKPFRGDIIIRISPFYAWKGDNEYRTASLYSWYGMKGYLSDSE